MSLLAFPLDGLASEEDPRQCGFACSVFTDECNLLAATDL